MISRMDYVQEEADAASKVWVSLFVIMQSLILVTFGMENKFYEMLVKEGIQCTACQIL